MTVDTIERVRDLIEEMQADVMGVSSAWEYTNTMNNKRMFAVFPASQHCDIFGSPRVSNPKQIWSRQDGFFNGYEEWNDEDAE